MVAKQDKLSRVAESVARSMLRAQDPELLSYSSIARRAGLSRGWIYKYLGADRSALLEHVVTHFAR